MNIFVVTGSPRKDGNTEIMAEAFAQAARAAGHTVAVHYLREERVAPCLACQYCFTHDGTCVQKDAMNGLLEELQRADMLVLASPIYWFDVSAQTKSFIDRMYALVKKGFHPRAAAMLLDSHSPRVYDAPTALLRALCAYLGWENKGVLAIPGMTQKGDMKKPENLARVREFAQNL